MGGRGAHIGVSHSNEKDSEHHGGSFRRYMELKNRKLHEQFRADQEELNETGEKCNSSEIFSGVVIHVNGVTNPSHQDLKRLMLIHGGRFANYYCKDFVTHIVCDHLPDTKLKKLLKSKSATPIVKAAWVVDSISAGKLLPVQQYAIQRLTVVPAQQLLAPVATNPTANLLSTDLYSQLNDCDLESGDTADEFDHVNKRQKVSLDDGALGNNEEQYSVDKQLAEDCPPSSGCPRDDSSKGKTWTEIKIIAARKVAAQMRAACEVLSGPPKSSADDPQFLQNYFKASRLHFIGTWRMRIEELLRKKAQQQELNVLGLSSHTVPAKKSSAHERLIMHVDMDCFFASVSIRNRPELQGVPLAVAHSNHASGHSEISCVNYIARKAGVRADMWMHQALEKCPDMVVIPYEFNLYQEVSEAIYHILTRHAAAVQPISCDESFLDITGTKNAIELAEKIREEIFSTTKCNASVGIGPNILVAKMATNRAKPDGIFQVLYQDVDNFLIDQKVYALPGVGYSTLQKLEQLGVKTIRDLRAQKSADLKQALGTKSAAEIINFAYGRDDRQVSTPVTRKSIGAEVNYGIRFSTFQDASSLLKGLSAEVARRLAFCNASGHSVALKLKKRKPGAPREPPKFLGHGPCINLSKSATITRSIREADCIFNAVLPLFNALAVPPDDVRGVGIVISKLDGTNGKGTKDAVASIAKLWNERKPAKCSPSNDSVPHNEASQGLTVPEQSVTCLEGQSLGGSTAQESNVDDHHTSPCRALDYDPVGPPEVEIVEPVWLDQEAKPALVRESTLVSTRPASAATESLPDPEKNGGVRVNTEQLPSSSQRIVAVPDARDLDMSVVDSLPATMRLELMREYGLHTNCKKQTTVVRGARRGVRERRGRGSTLFPGNSELQNSVPKKTPWTAPKRATRTDSAPTKTNFQGYHIAGFKSMFELEEDGNRLRGGKVEMSIQHSPKPCSDAPTKDKDIPTSSALSLERVLEHCRTGGKLGILSSPSTPEEILDLVSRCLQSFKSSTSVKPAAQTRANCNNESEPRQQLHALLISLASWHTTCFQSGRLLPVRQVCTRLAYERPDLDKSCCELIDQYISSVQTACLSVFGVRLDLR